jgi:NitT/TauT family transport system substrate-binding protein
MRREQKPMEGLKSITQVQTRARLLSALLRRRIIAAICLVIGVFSSGTANATDKLRIAVQKTGTFGWELAIIKDRGLDREADLDLEITELASTEAGKIALIGGAADVILSDWLWVSRERSLGHDLTFHPYSSALGAVVVPHHSTIKSLADLSGKKLAVAGGPLDKSWLLLQAFAMRDGIDLSSQATILYGTPALLTEKTRMGEANATLNFWNFCAILEAQGFKRLISMEEVEKSLGTEGPVAMVGYVFSDNFAAQHRDALQRFFAIAHKAKEILATSDDDWEKLAPRIGVFDKAALAAYRKAYIQGIPRRPIFEEAEDARKLYQVLAKVGGAKLVGLADALAPGTFYAESGVN